MGFFKPHFFGKHLMQQQNITGFSMQFWENIFKRMMIIYLNISIVFE